MNFAFRLPDVLLLCCLYDVFPCCVVCRVLHVKLCLGIVYVCMWACPCIYLCVYVCPIFLCVLMRMAQANDSSPDYLRTAVMLVCLGVVLRLIFSFLWFYYMFMWVLRVCVFRCDSCIF